MNTLIQSTLIFLASALVVVPLSNRLGFGSVLGYLVAGVLLGPSGFGFYNDIENTLHFAELGVVFLLFMIGLEIQPAKLLGMKNKIFSLGFFQIILCTMVFSPIVQMIFGLTWSLSFIIGFSLSLSSTAFALQTLNERNEFNTEPGQGAFTILITQDIAAIPLLALIPILFAQRSDSSSSYMWLFPFLLIALLLISRYLLRPLFRLLADNRSREIFTATALFIVLGVAVLMTSIGLSAALGTFIAGVLLAESEYRHELEANLDPFKSLLMGLFFMAVGMGVDLSLILQQPLLLLGGSLAYFLLKWFLITLIGRSNKMEPSSAAHMGFQIAQGGEFAFVILGTLSGYGILDLGVSKIIITMITLSMLLGPLLEKLLNYIQRNKVEVQTPKYDAINEAAPQIIIGGYGRFGQMFGRILRSQNISFVAIDHDSNHVETVRRFGNKVFYGDVTRIDLLHAAGAEKAKYFVLAIDDVELSLKTAKLLKNHFPHLTIFARARNRGHLFELMEMGVSHLKRETFDSSVNFVKELLIDLGYPSERAQLVIEKFTKHDEALIREQFKVRTDEAQFISVNMQATAQLAEVLKEESTKTYL